MNQLDHLDAVVTESDVESVFALILRRPVRNESYKQQLVADGVTLRQLIAQVRASDELRHKMESEIEGSQERPSDDPVYFRSPVDLRSSLLKIRKALIIGSCLSETWAQVIADRDPDFTRDVYSYAELPDLPAAPIDDYECQIVQIPLRAILPDGAFARLAQADREGHKRLFTHCAAAVHQALTRALKWNREFGKLTFVFPFMVPQQNLVGRLMPRFELQNPVFFVEELNRQIAKELDAYRNVHYFDVNEMFATHGRRFVQEDMIAAFNHGSVLTDFDHSHDGGRLEPAQKATDLYEERVAPIILATWAELGAMVRTLRQSDGVKMVVVDLDDTLWRGVIGENGAQGVGTTEGWPLGLWETLGILRRRGILLAIVSKNEERRVREAWDGIVGKNLRLEEDFAFIRINWATKSENLRDILQVANLLPRNVLFIDDNPAQRAEIQASFPEIRVLGGTPLRWRRLLLWAAETQVADVTAESGARTEMMRAQGEREELRTALSPEEFLNTLGIRMTVHRHRDSGDGRVARVLELINKTNQFNTTGERWTREAFTAALTDPAQRLYSFDLEDRFTNYGLVGVAIVVGSVIEQFVMSCRVMGLSAEVGFVAAVLKALRDEGYPQASGRVIETDRNLPCRDVYARCGFEPQPATGQWVSGLSPSLAVPAHIAVSGP